MSSLHMKIGDGEHPVHMTIIGFTAALLGGALVSDIVYLQTAQLQWTNFSAWLISGGLVFGGLAWPGR